MSNRLPFFETGVAAVPPEGNSFSYPCSLARLPDGRLMTTFTWNGYVPFRCAGAAAYSSDGGKSWSEPEELFSIHCPFEEDPVQPQNFADPTLVIIGDRIIAFCVSLRYVPEYWDLSGSRIWQRVSLDSGRTWSPIREFTKHKKYISGMVHAGLRLKDGSTVFGYSWEARAESGAMTKGEGDQDYHAGIFRTTDDGNTWVPEGDVHVHVPGLVKGKEYAIDGADEPAIAELDDGTLYMLLRTGTDHLWETRSADAGKSWTDPAPSPFISHNCPASLLKLQDGGILAVYNDHPIDRARLCARISGDGCRTWSEARVFAPAGFCGEPEASYPVVCQLDDGLIVATWGQVKRSNPHDRFKICYARFNREWVLM